MALHAQTDTTNGEQLVAIREVTAHSVEDLDQVLAVVRDALISLAESR